MEKPKKKAIYKLVLGDTSVSASAYIKGKKIADFGLTPMVASISGADLDRRGYIEIVVANTA